MKGKIMKADMEVAITKPGGGIAIVNKEVDLPFAPNVGMKISCVAWKSQREVENVTLTFDEDYGDPYLTLYMEIDKTQNEKEQNQLVEMYKACGWTLVGE
jgi:hypothetical protein